MKRIDFRDLQKYLHEIPNQFHSDELLEKIHSMDVHTAYALLGGYLAPLLSVEKKQTTTSTYPLLYLSTTPVQSSSTKEIREKVSKIITKWNDIDKAIKKMKEAMDALKNSNVMKDGALNIERIEDFVLHKRWKIVVIRDPNQEFKKVFDAQEDLINEVKKIKELINSVKGQLPDSSKKLINRMNEILKNITTDKQSYNFYYFEDDEVRFEIPADEVSIKNNHDYEGMRKFIQEFSFFKDQYDLEGYYKKHTLDLIGNSLKALLELIDQKKKDEVTIKNLEDRLEKLKQVKEDMTEKEEQIEKLTKQIKELKTKLEGKEALEQELINLKLEKDSLEQSKGEEIQGLNKRLAELDRRITELERLKNAEIEKLREDLKNVRDQLKIKEKEIKDGKIDEMSKELPDLQKILKDLENGGIDLRDLSKLRDKLDNLNRLTKDGKDEISNLEDLQKNIKELREELKKQKLIELEKQKETKEILDRENKLDELQRQILKIRQELKDLESLKGKDLTNLREKLEKLEKLQKEVGGSKDKVKELEDEVNRLHRELNKDKQDELDRQREIREREKEIERQTKQEEINKIKEIELKELKKRQGMMDAYVFMIVVFLTQLHTKQAEKLKTHGETLQKISRIFDQWNVIQKGLNTISQNANVILRWIKERKVDSNYTLYTDSNLSRKETDPRKLAIWNTFKSFLPDLQKNVKELRRILDEVRPDLPDSAKTLLDTMYKLSGRLLDIPDAKGDHDLTSYLKVTTESQGEIRVSKEIEDLKTKNKELLKDADKLTDEMSALRDDIGESRWYLADWALKAFWPSYYAKKENWNAKRRERDDIYTKIEANKKKIQKKEIEFRIETRKKIALPDKRLTILDWISDSDQTQFKAYMDNLAQGVTALTSISNMAQQELQIDTQYYNSLLGLQKAGMDSLTRTVQGILANMK